MVEQLFDAIRIMSVKYAEDVALLGKNHFIVERELQRLNGMEYAFEVVAGCSYTDYLFAKIDETLAQGKIFLSEKV